MDTGADGSGPYDPSPRQAPRSRKMWTKAEVEEIRERHDRGESWIAIGAVRQHPPYCNEHAPTKFHAALQRDR